MQISLFTYSRIFIQTYFGQKSMKTRDIEQFLIVLFSIFKNVCEIVSYSMKGLLFIYVREYKLSQKLG